MKNLSELNDCSGAAAHPLPRKKIKKSLKFALRRLNGRWTMSRKRKTPVKSVVEKFPGGSNYPRHEQDGPICSPVSSTEEEDDLDGQKFTPLSTTEEEDDQEGQKFTPVSSTEEEGDQEGQKFTPVSSTEEEDDQEGQKFTPVSSTEEEDDQEGQKFTPVSSTEEEDDQEGQKLTQFSSREEEDNENLGDFVATSIDANVTPRIISVNAGEDITMKIMSSYSQQGPHPRGICILSAYGAISSATLYQPASSGGTQTYEGGLFEILSLSGSYMVSETGGEARSSRSGGMSVSLAGPDGRVFGGRVAGLLVAASPVQVVVGSFPAGNQNA